MDTFRILQLIVVFVALVAVVFIFIQLLNGLLRFLERVLEGFSHARTWTSRTLQEYAPVVTRGSYLGTAIAILGAVAWLFVGSLWPVPLLVFLATVSGLVRRVISE